VNSAAFSPDGKQIVTASQDDTVRIWDTATGRQLLLLRGHTDWVTSAVFSPDGQQIVTASVDKTARVWDTKTGRQVLLLSGHTERVYSAMFSPDGQQIVTASADKTARIWDTKTGRQVSLLSGHLDGVLFAAFSPDGQQIVTASFDKTARIWDTATGRQVWLLSGHTDAVSTAVFSQDGQQIVTASDDKTARIWDARVSGLETQIEWARAAQFDSPSASERFQLGLPRSPDVRDWPSDASRCDRAAAAPYDPDRRAPGLLLGQIVPDIGLAACTQGGGDRNKNTRSIYQHGRALMAHGDFAAANRDFERAIGARYRAAQIDLAMLLSTPSAVVADPQKAILLYEQAWKDGVRIAAFQLGSLYEHGVSSAGDKNDYLLPPNKDQAWAWYEKAADAAEPNALARFGEKSDSAAFAEGNPAKKRQLLLDSFKYYAAAAELARTEDWQDDVWRNWRYRRASLARLLAREGMMQQVAEVYARVRKQYAWSPPMGQRIGEYLGISRVD
jgi:TPR repeat protein